MDWNNKEDVIREVQKDGWLLELASDGLKKDRDVIYVAVAQMPWAFGLAADELRDDENVVLDLLKYDEIIVSLASDRLRSDIRFMAKAGRQNRLAFKYAKKELQENPDFIRVTMQV